MTVEIPTPKVRAAWASDITPRPRASTIFRRRSLEYAFIAPCCHVAHPHRNTMYSTNGRESPFRTLATTSIRFTAEFSRATRFCVLSTCAKMHNTTPRPDQSASNTRLMTTVRVTLRTTLTTNQNRHPLPNVSNRLSPTTRAEPGPLKPGPARLPQLLQEPNRPAGSANRTSPSRD